jgi:hypothetical protein
MSVLALVYGSWHDGGVLFTNPAGLAEKILEAGRD